MASEGTVWDSHGISDVGETVRAVMDSRGWYCLQSVPNAYYLPADGHREDDSSSVCHGDDFLSEGSERTFSELDRLLNEHFEVTAGNMIGPGRPRQTRYLKRIIGYTEDLLVSSGRQTPSVSTSWCSGLVATVRGHGPPKVRAWSLWGPFVKPRRPAGAPAAVPEAGGTKGGCRALATTAAL